MPWKKGRVTFDDETSYDAEFLVDENGQVLNSKIYKDGEVIKEIDAQAFANKLGKPVEAVYPYKFNLGR